MFLQQCLCLLNGRHYEKVRTAIAAFSLAKKYLTAGQYFLVQHAAKKDGSFVYKHRWTGEAKMKLYIVQNTAVLKAT